MMTSLFLGKVVGAYLVVVGASLLLRKKMWHNVVRDFTKSSMAMTVAALFELLIGLFIVASHNVWVQSWEVVITIIGWLMVFEGIAYLFIPHKVLKEKIRAFDNTTWYTMGGIIALLLGAYMVYVSMGVGM